MDEHARAMAREAAAGDVDAWLEWRRTLRLADDRLELDEAMNRLFKACSRLWLAQRRINGVQGMIMRNRGWRSTGAQRPGEQRRGIQDKVAAGDKLLIRLQSDLERLLKRVRLALGALSKIPPFAGQHAGIPVLVEVVRHMDESGRVTDLHRDALDVLPAYFRRWSPRAWPQDGVEHVGADPFPWKKKVGVPDGVDIDVPYEDMRASVMVDDEIGEIECVGDPWSPDALDEEDEEVEEPD